MNASYKTRKEIVLARKAAAEFEAKLLSELTVAELRVLVKRTVSDAFAEERKQEENRRRFPFGMPTFGNQERT